MEFNIVHNWRTVLWEIDDKIVSNLKTEEIIQTIVDALMIKNKKKEISFDKKIRDAKSVSDLFDN